MSMSLCKLFSGHFVTHYNGVYWLLKYSLHDLRETSLSCSYLVSEQPKKGDVVKHHLSMYRTEILHTFPN